jgi:glutaminyl-tRNA synthetase
LEVVIDNYPEGQEEHFEAPLFPRDVPKEGTRPLPFSRTIYIDREDFAEEPPKGWFRLAPGGEVRLRYAYLIKCTKVVKNERGEIERLHCTYDPASRGGNAPDGRVVKGTIHWVSAGHAVPVEVRLYDRLFSVEVPDAEEGDFRSHLNPDSLEVLSGCRVEPSVASASPGDRFQFERQGYFFVDQDAKPGALVFNRTVTLRDTWAKRVRQAEAQRPAPREAQPTGAPREAHAKLSSAPSESERSLSQEQTEAAARLAAKGIDARQATLIVSREGLMPWFDEAVAVHDDAAEVAKWIVNELVRAIKDRPLSSLPFDGAAFGELVAMVARGDVSALSAKDVLAGMVAGQGRAGAIVAQRDLQQITSEEAVASLVDEVLAQHPDDVARFREGKTALLGFFVGLVMRASKGKGNPALVKQILEKRLSR